MTPIPEPSSSPAGRSPSKTLGKVGPSCILCVLSGYVGIGLYGLSADVPYARKNATGCLVQRDRLNQASFLEFRGMRDGDTNELGVRPCLPVGPAVYGTDFSFSLVF